MELLAKCFLWKGEVWKRWLTQHPTTDVEIDVRFFTNYFEALPDKLVCGGRPEHRFYRMQHDQCIEDIYSAQKNVNTNVDGHTLRIFYGIHKIAQSGDRELHWVYFPWTQRHLWAIMKPLHRLDQHNPASNVNTTCSSVRSTSPGKYTGRCDPN